MIGLIFDLDGTLLNTLEDLADATNAILRQFGYPERSLKEIRSFLGNGAQRQLTLAVPEGADWREPLEAYRAYYPLHCREKTAPYPGVCRALEQLKERFPMAIVSNKPDGAVKELCADFFPGIYALGETRDYPRKPAPDMVYAAMKAVGMDHCIFVGDSEVDILTAKNGGFPCLTVLWGFRDEPELIAAGADYFCHTPEELVEMAVKLAGEMEKSPAGKGF